MNNPQVVRLLRRGSCHVLGDDVSLDDDIIPARFATERVTDPDQLIAHLFEKLDPDFARRVRRGDILFAGRNFACGKPRFQGLIALAALDLSVVCESMPFKILRRAVARGVPVIVGCTAARERVATGEQVEIDFATGSLANLTRNERGVLPAMPAILRDIVAAGGAEPLLRAWLAQHPEQAISPE